MIALNPYFDKVKLKKDYFTFYKTKILSDLNKHFKHEDLSGNSNYILELSKYQAIFTYFSMVKFNIADNTLTLEEVSDKFDLNTMKDNLTRLGFKIKDILTIFDISENILLY